MEKSKTSQILRNLMAEVNISEAELARKTGIPQPTLHRILSGATRSPRGASLSPLANFFSISISQLIGDDKLPTDRIPGTYNPGIQGWTSIPVISWEDAVHWPKLRSDMEKNQWDNWLSTDAHVSQEAFALVVHGDAMAPRFMEGTHLIIEPAYSPQDKDFVIVHIKGNKTTTFKQLLIDGDDYYLKPINPEFRTLELKSKNYRFVGVVVQARTDFRNEAAMMLETSD